MEISFDESSFLDVSNKVAIDDDNNVSTDLSEKEYLQCTPTHSRVSIFVCIIPVQIYDPVQTSTSNGFISRLEEKMSPAYKLERRLTPDEVSRDEPLLVLCQNYSRVVTDIKDATGDLSDIPDSKKAVIILHVKQESSLPTLKTKDTIIDEKCTKFGLLVDFAYINGSIYPCKMNEEGSNTLRLFLKNHCKPETVRKEQKEHHLEVERNTIAPGAAASMDQSIASSGDAQFYREKDSKEVEKFLKSTGIESIPGMNEVSSLTTLGKDKCWIILCTKGSYVEKEILPAQPRNAKVLILLQKWIKDYTIELDGVNALVKITIKPKTTDFSSILFDLRKRIPNTDDRFQWFFACVEIIVYSHKKDNGTHGSGHKDCTFM